jgi:hypothetical protein
MGELRLKVIDKFRVGNDEWQFLIGKAGVHKDDPDLSEKCIPIYSGFENNPYIYEEEADAIRRRFNPKSTKKPNEPFTKLGL